MPFRYRYFLRLQLIRIGRILKDAGLGYIIILLPMLFVLLLYIYGKVLTIKTPGVPAILYLLLVGVIHVKRRDLDFLKQFGLFHRRLFVLEYSMYCLPITILFLVAGKWISVVVGHSIVLFFVALIPFLPQQQLTFRKSNWSLAWIPSTLFEWKGSIRASNILSILLYTLGLVLALHPFIYVLYMLFIAIFISTTFRCCEGKELLGSSYTLEKKIWHNHAFLIVLFIPHTIFYLIWHFEYYWIAISVIIYLLIYQTYCIVYKYANYAQYRIEVDNSIPATLFVLLCPVLPISLTLIYTYYRRSKNILSHA